MNNKAKRSGAEKTEDQPERRVRVTERDNDRLVDVGLEHEESRRRGSTTSRPDRAATRMSVMTSVS
jgi:hypothetical protein